MQTGLFVMPAADYLADPAPVPSLSSSIARILVAESPRHAWHRHPKLNPQYVPEEWEAYDLGTAAHQVLLEGTTAGLVILDADDYRTKAAKEARDAARAAGKTPMLARQFAEVERMAVAVTLQLDDLEPPVPFVAEHGAPEQTLVWEEDGVWCRARLDWLTKDRRVIFDLKTTSASANPETFARMLFAAGYDVQAAFYLRGLRAVCGVEAEFRFVVVENAPPYAVSLIRLAPDALALGNAKVSRAVAMWRVCQETGEWPGYAPGVVEVDAPPWEYAKFDAGESLYEQAERLGKGSAR